MRRLIISVALALIIVFVSGAPVFAWGNESVNVTVSGINVDLGGHTNPYVGNTVTASGTVTIVAEANAGGALVAIAVAESSAGFSVSDPSSVVVDSGTSSQADAGLGGLWVLPANADASQTYSWSSTFTLDSEGNYIISQDGSAAAGWVTLLPSEGGSESDSASNAVSLLAIKPPPPPIASMGGGGCLYAGYLNRLLVLVGNQKVGFYWVERPAWRCGKTLAEDAVVKWTFWDGEWHTFLLVIPGGTVITGWNGMKQYFLEIIAYQGTIFLNPAYMWFSNPATIYELVDGEWVVVVAFSQIAKGKAVPIVK